MSRPGTFHLNLYRGDTYVWKFTLYGSTTAPNPPVPADLTGVTAKAEIRTSPGGSPLTTLECEVTLPNVITMKLTTPEWLGITVRRASWDLQLTYSDPDSTVITVLAGDVVITPDVTDSTPISATAQGGVATTRITAHV